MEGSELGPREESDDARDREIIRSLVPGGKDHHGKDIETLILKTSEFAVWLTASDFEIWWITVGSIEDLPAGHGEISSRVALLESVQIGSLPADLRRSFRCLVGEGLARALEGDLAAAQKTLDYSESYIKARLGERARLWQLALALPVGALAVVVMLIALVWNACDRFTFCAAIPIEPFYCSGMGILGAVFFLVTRVGKVSADPAAGIELQLLEVTARLATGAVAGFLVASAVRAGFLFPQLKDGTVMGFLLVGFVAGASERLIPNLVSSLESQTAAISNRNDSTPTPPAPASTPASTPGSGGASPAAS